MNRQNLMKCVKPHRGEGDTAERDEHLPNEKQTKCASESRFDRARRHAERISWAMSIRPLGEKMIDMKLVITRRLLPHRHRHRLSPSPAPDGLLPLRTRCRLFLLWRGIN